MGVASQPRHAQAFNHGAAQYHSATSTDMAHLLDSLHEYLQQTPENKLDPHWVIKESNLGGRGLFASKPIKQGSLIFVNKPLVVAARGDSVATKFCSVCFQISGVCFNCKKCWLLVCSEKCHISPEHVKDCDFITKNWILKSNIERDSITLASVLIYLRCLLLPETQMEILAVFQQNKSNNIDKEIEALCSKYQIPEEHVQFMKAVDSVLRTNSFRISHNPDEDRVPLRGLYPLSALLNHSCTPNTRNVFRKDFTMAVYAARDITIGEEILSCYTGLLWCTPARRCQLYKTKHFWCACHRCKDSTEMGTKLSALNCLNKKCGGVILPVNPLDTGTEWCCDNCNAVVLPAQVSTMQSVLGGIVGTLDLDNQFQLETFLEERLANFIPYSSHIFVDLQLRLALKLGYAEGVKLTELSESRLALKERLCRGTLRTLATLGVGDAHLRGLLLYHLHAALAERARRSPELYEEMKSEIESTIEQAYNILRGDISSPPDLELRHRYLGPGCDKPHEERFHILNA